GVGEQFLSLLAQLLVGLATLFALLGGVALATHQASPASACAAFCSRALRVWPSRAMRCSTAVEAPASRAASHKSRSWPEVPRSRSSARDSSQYSSPISAGPPPSVADSAGTGWDWRACLP